MTQGTLFDTGVGTEYGRFYGGTPPHAKRRDTSKAAAVDIKPGAARLRAQVLEYIRSRGQEGATDAEVQAALNMAGNTQRPRRRELEQAESIRDSGKRRATESGRSAVVWIATEF